MAFAYSTSAVVAEEIGDHPNRAPIPVNVDTLLQPESQEMIFNHEIGAATAAERNETNQVVSDSVLLGRILNNMQSLQTSLQNIEKTEGKIEAEISRMEGIEQHILESSTLKSIMCSKRAWAGIFVLYLAIPCILGLTYYIVYKSKDLTVVNGKLVGVNSDSPLLTSSADFLLVPSESGYTMSIRNDHPARRATCSANFSSDKSCNASVPVSVSQNLLKGMLSSRMSDASLQEMRYLKLELKNSFLSFEVKAVARYPDASSMYGTVVVIYSDLGQLTMDGETMIVQEELRGLLVRAGFLVDSKSRRLVSVAQILGFFNYLSSSDLVLTSQRIVGENNVSTKANKSLPTTESETSPAAPSLPTVSTPPTIFYTNLNVVTYCQRPDGTSTSSCENYDDRQLVDWIDVTEGMPAVTRSEQLYSLDFGGYLYSRSVETSGQWPGQSYVEIQNESHKLSYQTYEGVQFYCTLVEDDSLLQAKVQKQIKPINANVTFLGQVHLSGISCNHYEILDGHVKFSILQDSISGHIVQANFSNIVWKFSEMTVFNDTKYYPLSSTDFDIERIAKRCGDSSLLPPPKMSGAVLSNKVLPQSDWGRVKQSNPSSNYSVKQADVVTVTGYMQPSAGEQCRQLPPQDLRYGTWEGTDCPDRVTFLLSSKPGSLLRDPCFASAGNIAMEFWKDTVNGTGQFEGGVQLRLRLCACAQQYGVQGNIPDFYRDLGLCSTEDIGDFWFSSQSSRPIMWESLEEDSSCKKSDDFVAPLIGYSPSMPYMEFTSTRKVDSPTGIATLTLTAVMRIYVGMYCRTLEASGEGILVGSSLKVVIGAVMRTGNINVPNFTLNLDPAYSTRSTCSESYTPLSVFAKSSEGSYIFTNTNDGRKISFTKLYHSGGESMGQYSCLGGIQRAQCNQSEYIPGYLMGCKKGGTISRLTNGQNETTDYVLPARYLELIRFNFTSESDTLTLYSCDPSLVAPIWHSTAKNKCRNLSAISGPSRGAKKKYVSDSGLFLVTWNSKSATTTSGWELKYFFTDTFEDVLKLPQFSNGAICAKNQSGESDSALCSFAIENALLRYSFASSTPLIGTCLVPWNESSILEMSTVAILDAEPRVGFSSCLSADPGGITWSIYTTPDDYTYFVAVVSGIERNLCLSINPSSSELILGTCVGELHSQWRLEFNASSGLYQIRNRVSNFCVGAMGFRKESGAPCTGAAAHSKGCSQCSDYSCLQSSMNNAAEVLDCSVFSKNANQWIIKAVSKADIQNSGRRVSIPPSNAYSISGLQAICGLSQAESIKRLDPPPLMQDLFQFTMGYSFTIGALPTKSAACESDPTKCSPCEDLSEIMSDVYMYIQVGFGTGSSQSLTASKLLVGQDAENAKQARMGSKYKAVSTPTTKGFLGKVGTVAKYIDSIMPMCIAVRPCSGKNLGVDSNVSWGFSSTGGISFPIKIPITPEPPIYKEITLKIGAAAFSTVSALQAEAILSAPPLFDNAYPPGMTMWVKMALAIPIELDDSPSLGDLEFEGQVGIYMSGLAPLLAIPGQSFDTLLLFMLGQNNEATAYWKGIIGGLKNSNMVLSIFGTISAKIALDVSELTGVPNLKLDIPLGCKPACPSFMITTQYAYGVLGFQLWFSIRMGFTEETNPLIAISKSKLGRFGEWIINNLVPIQAASVDIKATAGIKTVVDRDTYSSAVQSGFITALGDNRLYGIDFGFELYATFKLNCGILLDILKVFLDIVDAFVKLLSGFGVKTDDVKATINNVRNIINAICTSQYQFAIRATVRDNHIIPKETYIYLNMTLDSKSTIPSYNRNLTLDDLPHCPAGDGGIMVGARCAVDPLKDGSYFSDCFGLSYGKQWWGRCENHPKFMTSIGCLGRCQHKLDEGMSCDKGTLHVFGPDILSAQLPTQDAACKSGKCICNRCGLANASQICNRDADCRSGLYCRPSEVTPGIWDTAFCKGTCQPLIPPGGDCGAIKNVGGPAVPSHFACQYGQCWCNTCMDQNKQFPQGYSCNYDRDCQTGYCKLPWGAISVGCRGTCAYKVGDGSDCVLDADCTSGHCNCKQCANGNNQLANNLKCGVNSDCQSGYCERGNGVCGLLPGTGVCKAKKAPGEWCGDSVSGLFGADSSCLYGNCLCNTCAYPWGQVLFGKSCNRNSQCFIGFCDRSNYFQDCSGTCIEKTGDGAWCGDRDGNRCWSGSCICQRCGYIGSGRMPRGYDCSMDSDCISWRCNQKVWWQVTWACNGWCD